MEHVYSKLAIIFPLFYKVWVQVFGVCTILSQDKSGFRILIPQMDEENVHRLYIFKMPWNLICLLITAAMIGKEDRCRLKPH